MTVKTDEKMERRTRRNRVRIRKAANGRLRLSVHRSNCHIYAQVIDDLKGVTLVAASTMDKELKGKLKSGGNIDAASAVGKLIGERAVKAGVKEVIYDRGGCVYHGRVKALAEAAREAGLSF
jgi:large subunit ribosomal protein L18